MAHRRRVARVFLVLLVAVPLCVPSAWGAPRRLPVEPNPFDAIVRLWEGLVSIWSESGCGIDPNGSCGTSQPEPTAPTTDSGCGIDPFGGCTPGS